MFDIYGLDTVSRYEGRILGTLPPHLFAMGATAYNRLLAKDGQNQVLLMIYCNEFLKKTWNRQIVLWQFC
jgi:myosin heavy subunit